jgi:Protein of unknown function (DUF3485)
MSDSETSSTVRPNPWLVGLKKAGKEPAFIVAVLVLLVAAVGLNGATQFMQLHFKKLPVPLARDLDKITPDLGDWYQVSKDQPLEKETQDVLGTDKYIFRDYVNVGNTNTGKAGAEMMVAIHAMDRATTQPSGVVGDAIRAANHAEDDQLEQSFLIKPVTERKAALEAALKDKSSTERKTILNLVQRDHPDGVVNMAVTYYTGMVDTVAHVPDRCYIADGYEASQYDVPTWRLGSSPQSPDDKQGRTLEVRFIDFQDQVGDRGVDRNVAYFFQVNGHYEQDPLGVRRSLQNLLEKYGYYAKVELMTLDRDHDRAARTMTNFLTPALPEVEKSFPDWYRVHHPDGK